MKIKMNTKRTLLILFVALAVSLGAWTYIKAEGQQITVCAKKSGLVYVIGEDFRRVDCKKNDTLLSWNITGPQGPKGDTGERGFVGPTLHLYDANGQNLGSLVTASDALGRYFITFLSGENVFLVADQNANGISLHGGGQGGLYFLERDCGGTPYTNLWANPTGATYSSGQRFFKYTTGLASSQQPLSVFDSRGCVNELPGAGEIYPLQEFSLPFSLPLAWPLEVRES